MNPNSYHFKTTPTTIWPDEDGTGTNTIPTIMTLSIEDFQGETQSTLRTTLLPGFRHWTKPATRGAFGRPRALRK